MKIFAANSWTFQDWKKYILLKIWFFWYVEKTKCDVLKAYGLYDIEEKFILIYI